MQIYLHCRGTECSLIVISSIPISEMQRDEQLQRTHGSNFWIRSHSSVQTAQDMGGTQLVVFKSWWHHFREFLIHSRRVLKNWRRQWIKPTITRSTELHCAPQPCRVFHIWACIWQTWCSLMKATRTQWDTWYSFPKGSKCRMWSVRFSNTNSHLSTLRRFLDFTNGSETCALLKMKTRCTQSLCNGNLENPEEDLIDLKSENISLLVILLIN